MRKLSPTKFTAKVINIFVITHCSCFEPYLIGWELSKMKMRRKSRYKTFRRVVSSFFIILDSILQEIIQSLHCGVFAHLPFWFNFLFPWMNRQEIKFIKRRLILGTDKIKFGFRQWFSWCFTSLNASLSIKWSKYFVRCSIVFENRFWFPQ